MLGQVLDELNAHLNASNHADRSFGVAVGLNGSTDQSGQIAAAKGALVGTTDTIGYGHGCLAAIAAAKENGRSSDAYVFYAGDGANDPSELNSLLNAYELGAEFVIGCRTTNLANWRRPFTRSVANLLLGLWASLLSGKVYFDLGAFRVIDRDLFERLHLTELKWGWTIEPQILAPGLGAKIQQIPVSERKRVAGQQKISGVSLTRTLRIGAAIFGASLRAFRRRYFSS